MINIKDLNVKKDILIELGKTEAILKQITINTAELNIDWLHHARISTGYIRDAIRELSEDIIKQDKKEHGRNNN